MDESMPEIVASTNRAIDETRQMVRVLREQAAQVRVAVNASRALLEGARVGLKTRSDALLRMQDWSDSLKSRVD